MKINGKILAIIAFAIGLMLIGFMGGALMNKPDEKAHVTAQAELQKTVRDRDEELKRKEKAHLEEIEALNRLHDETVKRLEAEIAAKNTIALQQGEVIVSRNKWLFGGGIAFLVSIVLSTIVGASFGGAARKSCVCKEGGDSKVGVV